jgi:penicillin-binding protein 2
VNKALLSCLLLTVLLAACGKPTPIPDAAPAATLLSPTPIPIPDAPEATAAAFLNAWQSGDPATIYALLSPASQAAADAASFSLRYQTALQAATVLTATAALRAVLQEGDQAQAAYDVTWDTALVGPLTASATMSLLRADGQWQVEGSGDLIWPGLGAANYFYMERQIPARANIYDRNGLALAAEGTIVTVGVVPGQIQDEQAVLAALALVTDRPAEEIRARYAGNPADWWTPIVDISAQVSVDHANVLYNTPGIVAHEKEGRAYWDSGVAPHVVGWVAPIPAEQVAAYRAQGYTGDEWVGVTGLEEWAEPYLAGHHGGTLYLLDPAGAPLTVLAQQEATPSRAIYTTIDRNLQQQVQRILGDRRGAIVVLDPHSGAILALASSPSFDPNVFVGPTDAGRSEVLANPDHPLFNRATQGTYPCGSVFKIVTIAAALEDAGMTAETPFWCPGYWEGLGPSSRKDCWKKEGHGNINLQDALTASCDVTFYAVGQALDSISADIIPTFARAFGLGVPTGLVELPEEAGLMPDPAWKQATYGETWWAGDTINLAIGQGYMLTTPLQVARMIAAVANGGTLYRPYLVERIAAGGVEPETVTQPLATGTLPVSPETLAVIHAALLGVTSNPIGTAAHRFVGLDIPVAGKTGTAEAPGSGDVMPHSWFAAYAPADDPQLAIVVMVENIGEGSTVAAPMTRQVVEAYYGRPLTPLPPLPTPTPMP